jgi:hypothetical protein
VFITAVPITKMFARVPITKLFARGMCVYVFITAVPITNLFSRGVFITAAPIVIFVSARKKKTVNHLTVPCGLSRKNKIKDTSSGSWFF